MPQGQKILVADDDASIREILSIQLARLNYTVLVARDGQEALKIYTKENLDLLILDVMMPNLNGHEVCQAIRQLEKKSGNRIPIIFLTARDTTHAKTSAALSGGDAFIAKPVSLQELRESVEAALTKKGLS